MTEIFSIVVQFLIFLIIFSFPFTPKFLANHFGDDKSFNLIDAHSINIIFFCYICILFSFFTIDLKIFFWIYFVLSLTFIIYKFSRSKINFKKVDLSLFFIFFLIVISIFISISQNLKLEWDGHFWLEKALIFFNGESIENLKDTKTNPGYPHLGPYIWAFFWKNSIIGLEYFGRFFYVYFYLVSIFLIFNCLNNENRNIKILLLLFFTLITYEPYLLGGYQEYLIFSALIIASRYISLINFKNIKNVKLIFLILMILYINCWFKNEGLIYFLIFSFLLILFLNISIRNKLLFIIFIFLLVLTQYILQKYIVGIYDFPEKPSFSDIFHDIINLKILFTKVFKIFLHIMIAFVKYPLWLMVLAVFYFQLFISKNITINIKYFFLCFLINILFIFSIFFTFKNFDFMLRVSLDRLLFQTSGFFLITFILTLNKIKIKLYK